MREQRFPEGCKCIPHSWDGVKVDEICDSFKGEEEICDYCFHDRDCHEDTPLFPQERTP